MMDFSAAADRLVVQHIAAPIPMFFPEEKIRNAIRNSTDICSANSVLGKSAEAAASKSCPNTTIVVIIVLHWLVRERR